MSIPRILVLEDDPQVNEILTQVLTDEGYEVVSVDRGEAAVAKAKELDFDLIVADIRMEGIGGLAAIEQARAVQPDIGTLVASAYSDPEETEKAKELGVGAYLRKPFKMKDFLFAVHRQLERGFPSNDDDTVDRGEGAGTLELLEHCLSALSRDKTPSIARVSELTKSLGRQLELDQQIVREVTAACCYLLHTEDTLNLEVWTGPKEQLASFRSALLFWEESVNGENPPPIEAKMTAVVLAALREETNPKSVWSLAKLANPEKSLSLILNRHPHLDPKLVELCFGAKAKADKISSTAPPRSEGNKRAKFMLALAKTLEVAGNDEDAQQAYRTLTELAPSRESVRAQIALARIQGNDLDQQALSLACRQAYRLGPVFGSHISLEAGHLAFHQAPDMARELLSGAVAGLESLGFENALARAAIPLIALGKKLPEKRFTRIVGALLSKAEREETARDGRWMFPILFDNLPERPSESLYIELGKLVECFPKLFAQSFQDGHFRDSSGEHLLSALSAGPRRLPAELLRAMSQDQRLGEKARQLAHTSTSESQVARIRVSSFGDFEVHVDDRKLEGDDWKTQKNRLLFAFLASRWGKSVPEERVREVFWPNNLERGKRRVYWSTSIIRGCFKSVLETETTILERENEALRLNPEVDRCHDLEEFHRLLKRAKQLDNDKSAAKSRPLYRRLVQLKKGPYLETCYADWAVRYRDSLERQFEDCLVRLGSLAHSQRDYQEALEASSQALECDPCRQEAAQIAMESLIDSGQPERALEVFQTIERRLRADYEIEPNTELLKLLYRAKLGKDNPEGTLIG